jgi:hypothetical protein
LLAGVAAIGLLKLFRRGQLDADAGEEAQPAIRSAPLRVRVQPRPVAAPVETPTLFLHDGALQTGPFTLTQVQAMLRSGQINHEVQYWSEGLDEWQSVAELSDRPSG